MDCSRDGEKCLKAQLIENRERLGPEFDGGEREGRKWIVDEVKRRLWLAGPLISVNLLQYSLNIISLMFVGHVGELDLAGASMATSFASVTGFGLLIGMASALDTLCGQSYGAKCYDKLGIHMQRAMFVLLIVSIPITAVWANTRSILIFFGQDEAIAEVAGFYSCVLIPSIFARALLCPLNIFLQAQNDVFPMMMTSGTVTIIHILICWLLLFKTGMGYQGAAMAVTISSWINVLLLARYVKYSPSCKKTWTGFSKEALQNVSSFLKLAIPSMAMVCLEMWSFESMVLFSGLLPDPLLETSVLSICLNTASAVWMIPYGLSGAVSVRVSNELGARHPRRARLAVFVVLLMAVAEGLLIGAIMLLIRNIWGYAYSNEEAVVVYVANMMPILAVSNFLDGIQCVLSGTARGCGWQEIGAYVILGSYYVVGIPSSVLLGFIFHLDGRGLWLGIMFALAVQVLCLSIITACTDWDKETRRATERVYVDTIPRDAVS